MISEDEFPLRFALAGIEFFDVAYFEQFANKIFAFLTLLFL